MLLLLKYNADVEGGFANDSTYLIIAVQDQNIKMIKLLLSYDAETNV